MLDGVAQAIDRFYKQKDYNAFKAACLKKIQFPRDLKEYINLNGLLLDASNDMNHPSKTWYIKFKDYSKGLFNISYQTIIGISKIAPFFYLQHEFKADNKDGRRCDSDLDGFGDEPYCKGQSDLGNQITSILMKKGYTRLYLQDRNEVIAEFNMPQGVTIFGPQITVEHLLFLDLFDISTIHCCSLMDTFLEEPNTSIFYSSAMRSYYIAPKKNVIGQELIYCPWCARKLPESLSYKYYDILKDEYNINFYPGIEKSKSFPKDFKTDAWWKKRGL